MKEALSKNDEIIFLFDNCTDGSFETFKKLENYLPCKKKIIITHDDLYEVKANNRILKEATKEVIILFQDDIVNHDKDLKKKVFNVLKSIKNPGLLGGRSGYELTGNPALPERAYYRVSNWEHKAKQYGKRLEEGGFEKRTFLNRGPIVFTRKLLDEVGYLDEAFYPLWGDDLDFCARCKFKYRKDNAIFQCNVESQLKWGATHSGQSKVDFGKAVKTNWKTFIDRWGETMKDNYEKNTAKLKR